MDTVLKPLFTTKTNGIGLGLATVKQHIDNHNGEIKITSEVGKGTSFILELPI